MMEQNINLNSRFKLGKTPEEIYAMLMRVYEDPTLSMKCVYEWFTRFRECRSRVSLSSGRSATSCREEIIDKVSFTFFDSQRIIHKEFPHEGTTMNAARYMEVMPRFMKCLCRVRSQYAQGS
ncbi:hypothetical protein TNCV_1340841 [Trichonephila clavipes]|nr:hypothetical protein TNCV_1340841 [Trichonephila clavipes]